MEPPDYRSGALWSRAEQLGRDLRENFLYSFKRRASPDGPTCGASGPRFATVRALLGGSIT
jgi:hypothetical protein